jgi:hypothetical protein
MVLWLLMLSLLGGAAFYVFGPYEHRETWNYVAGAAAILGLVLWFVVGAWGRDLHELRADFDDPLDEYDGSGPSSGRDGEPF